MVKISVYLNRHVFVMVGLSPVTAVPDRRGIHIIFLISPWKHIMLVSHYMFSWRNKKNISIFQEKKCLIWNKDYVFDGECLFSFFFFFFFLLFCCCFCYCCLFVLLVSALDVMSSQRRFSSACTYAQSQSPLGALEIFKNPRVLSGRHTRLIRPR